MFQLDIIFELKDLEIFKSKYATIVVAKPTLVVENTGRKTSTVVWQLITPFEANLIEFDEVLGVYAAKETTRYDVVDILTKTKTPSLPNQLYTLTNNGEITINNPTESEAASYSGYAFKNNYSHEPSMTMGLYQSAIVNGSTIKNNIISANTAVFKSVMLMIPSTNLTIWTNVESLKTNEIIDIKEISAIPTVIEFDKNSSRRVCKYNAQLNTFVLVT
ncbi:hypothetical protein [uncultured Psychroserpens sp.]|uniref:hypothetical protein n=1 Tax=uncultured Psychroserpens sp. TaxID=255436 RepID=UPI002631CB8F|nr:hypothetical protein [uncultured Psychroserpens sp.]